MTEQERFERAKFIAKLVDEFKLFCMDSIMDGMGDDHEDHFEFLESALEVFTDTMSMIDEDLEHDPECHPGKKCECRLTSKYRSHK